MKSQKAKVKGKNQYFSRSSYNNVYKHVFNPEPCNDCCLSSGIAFGSCYAIVLTQNKKKKNVKQHKEKV